MATNTTACSPAPNFSGDRDDLTMEEREKDLDEAIQWVKDELSSLKSQDQSLMRQFLALRSQINNLKDVLPTSLGRNSTSELYSPKRYDDEEVFFAGESRTRFSSQLSSRGKSFSSGSDDEKY